MIVLSFIVGFILGASLGIILFSLLIAGKNNDITNLICAECKRKYAVDDKEVKTILEKIVQR